ncbi:ABC transporter substrate-binding protein [Mycolicibacterium agri]|uniref:ABC transporter substrate-binding protein n=1 Tax=Mycolicibacterium agri TaxID=36811 RepID=A0A2A7NDA5_MYCAG|nr:extracellular solute-binding protein [Mycolicibacterium agri]PEG41431.1 ABC transporter substrate-binding protein [Mycolicibacterium agri]GFG53017.1 iron ABC transporter substrate-binding protein [Mycolicibacterium agri]
MKSVPPSARAGGTRRLVRIAAVFGAVIMALTACGSGESTEPGADNVVKTGEAPDYYPADYQDLIAASQNEGGTLTIYSNTDQENWAPIFRDFKKKYPWVGEISANNLDSDEVFQRVLSEQATAGSPADIVVSNAAQAWADFGARPGTLMEYKSPEVAKLPEQATLMPNVYAMSLDPIAIVYNTSLMTEQPTGVKSLADIVSKDPDKYRGKITTRDVNGAFGFTVSNGFVSARPDSWSALDKVLPMAKAETSSGTQLEKITSGEYLAGMFISAAPTYPKVDDSGGLLGISFYDDGTVVLPRGVGIASGAPHPATAKLFTDFVLSDEGQRAVAEGGLTSYRDGIEATDGRHTYQELVESVGEDNVIDVQYVKVPEDKVKEFTDRWDGLLGR